ncbi:hypothetical protein [Saccharothrix yanglingensis]|nr:hypothetical protein [Saccharothrix yanglingensis]
MRHSVTVPDASHPPLAEQPGVPVITCDGKLAGSNGHDVDIEVHPVS